MLPKRACIALDVSKGNSHMQAFYSAGFKATDVMIIQHDKNGFNTLNELIKKIEAETNDTVAIVFESTGSYSKPLEHFLWSIHKKYYLVPPLLSAKVRKSDIRPTKTDAIDCETIANVYYLKNLKEADRLNKISLRLKNYSSYYLFYINREVETKIKYRQYLDIVYPKIDEYFDVMALSFIEFIKNNPDPNKLIKRSHEDIYKRFLKFSYCGEIKSKARATSIKRYLSEAMITIDSDNPEITILADVAKVLLEDLNHLENMLNEIIVLAMKTEEYKYIVTIPGLSKNTAARISAEIAGIDRFSSASKFVAYIGIDPTVCQSGKLTGEHLNITHKGNQRLRCLLYLVCVGSLKNRRDYNPIRDFIIKKKNDGLAPKAAIVAGCNKLARIIYAVCSKREVFSIQQ